MTAIEAFKTAQARLLQRYGVEAESRHVKVPSVQNMLTSSTPEQVRRSC